MNKTIFNEPHMEANLLAKRERPLRYNAVGSFDVYDKAVEGVNCSLFS